MNQTFKIVPKTGVIYVIQEAIKLGFYRGNPEWCNLGQGQPETGKIPGGVARIKDISLELIDQEYAPVGGLKELRIGIADMYNKLYRVGKSSQYTFENVSVCPGGRPALTRLAATIGNINLGHFLPDYTAYEELLSTFHSFNTIPILLDGERGYNFPIEELRREILGRGLGALLISNPCNPTGKVIPGNTLKQWVEVGNELDCAMLMDEFYNSYIYTGTTGNKPISAASYIEDVNEDQTVIISGITKNWRYPGWRIAWVIGPKDVASAVTSAGSYLDGGAPRPLQKMSVGLMDPVRVLDETEALQRHFRQKRRVLLDGLQDIGVTFEREPEGAFYAWGDVKNLPEHLNTGEKFFRAALNEKVVVVPGKYFDINPGKRRSTSNGRFNTYVRFSFGPEIEAIEEAMTRLKWML